MHLDLHRAPLPPEWKAGLRASHVVLGGFLLLIAVGSLLVGFGHLATDVMSGVLFLAFGLFLGVIACMPAFGYLKRRDADSWQLSVEWVEPVSAYAVLIRYSRRATRGYVLIVVVAALALLLMVVALPLAGVGADLIASRGGPVFWFGSMLLIGYLAWVAIAMGRGTVTRGWLALAHDRVAHRGWGTTTVVRWDDVGVVAANSVKLNSFIVLAVPRGSDTYRVVHSRAAQGPEDNLKPHLAVRPRLLMIDPAVLLSALRFYHAVPEARAELADGRAIERIQWCDFGGGPA